MTADSTNGLLAQHKLLLAVINADWATRLDIKVAAAIIERYVRKFGNARASLSFLENATGSKRNKIIPSTRRLLEHGVAHVVREGVGTRPTEYGLNFQFAASSSLEGTSSDVAGSSALEGTPTGSPEGTSSGSSGTLEGTESSLTVAGLQAERTERENEPAAPTAPPTVGLSATAAVTAGEGNFRDLWKAYYPDKGKGRAEAEAAYAKLAPDADLHRQMVDAAREWHDAWSAQDKPDAPRYTLAKWIERKEYECAPPTAYRPKERKAKPAPTTPTAPARTIARVCHIIAADVSPDEYGSKLSLVFEVVGDRSDTFRHAIYIEHHDFKIQSAGMEEFTALCRVMNLPNVQDSEELMFHPLLVTQKRGGTLDYGCAPANFDLGEAA